MNECYDAIIQKESRNPIIIDYKLKLLSPDYIVVLKKRILNQKFELKLYDDLDCVYNEKFKGNMVSVDSESQLGLPKGGAVNEDGTMS